MRKKTRVRVVWCVVCERGRRVGCIFSALNTMNTAYNDPPAAHNRLNSIRAGRVSSQTLRSFVVPRPTTPHHSPPLPN